MAIAADASPFRRRGPSDATSLRGAEGAQALAAAVAKLPLRKLELDLRGNSLGPGAQVFCLRPSGLCDSRSAQHPSEDTSVTFPDCFAPFRLKPKLLEKPALPESQAKLHRFLSPAAVQGCRSDQAYQLLPRRLRERQSEPE